MGRNKNTPKTLIFCLPGISPKIPETKDELTLVPRPNDNDIELISLLHEKSNAFISFRNTYRDVAKYWICMKDLEGKEYPKKTDYPCWSHRCSFSSSPIGCPIGYDSETQTFSVEGIFCSLPCVKSYILEQLKKTPFSKKYSNSCTYLSLMALKIFGKSVEIPTIKNPWKQCQKWGGHLTEEEFSESLGRLSFSEFNNIRIPRMLLFPSYVQESRIDSK